MNRHIKTIVYWVLCLAVVLVGIGPEIYHQHFTSQAPRKAQVTTKPKHKQLAASHASYMRTPINWRKSSETIAYPNLASVKNLWILVHIRQNRVYVHSGNKVIYTMYCTAGQYHKDPKTGKEVSMSPTGTYHVQPERGKHFYNASVKVGANYYVSWNGNGQYLFHSVPTDPNGKYDLKQAAKLGKTQGSHGCVRLSVPDAKWFYQSLPEGTKVVVKN